MTRGKYAARATRRREDESVQSEIAAYRRHVRRLTAEVTDLAGKLAAEQAARRNETRRLRAMLSEGLSPELDVLREELEEQRQRARLAEDTYRRIRRINTNCFLAVFDVFSKGLGMGMVEAWELLISINPEATAELGEDVLISDIIERSGGQLTTEQIRAVEVARGYRRPADVAKFLRERVRGLRAEEEAQR